MGYEVRWIGGECGHYEIYKDNEFVISCDTNELTETLNELNE